MSNTRPRRPRVLVAEDHVDTRELLSWSLRADGFLVDEATNVDELLARIALGVSYDAIATDLCMPGQQGSALAALDEHRRGDVLRRVLLVTAFADEHVYFEAERLGVAGVLPKPVDLDELRRCVRLLAAQRDGAALAHRVGEQSELAYDSHTLALRAREGDVAALLKWRERLDPVDDDETGGSG